MLICSLRWGWDIRRSLYRSRAFCNNKTVMKRPNNPSENFTLNNSNLRLANTLSMLSGVKSYGEGGVRDEDGVDVGRTGVVWASLIGVLGRSCGG